MKYAQDQNGKMWSFPDDATPQMIEQALGLSSAPAAAAPTSTPVDAQQTGNGQELRAAPEQSTGFDRALKLAGNVLVSGVAKGVGLAGDVTSLAVHGADWLSGAVGLGRDPKLEENMQYLPTSENLLRLTGRAGLTNRADAIPGWGTNPMAERMLTRAGEGLTTGAVLAPLGPGGAVAKYVGTPLAGALGGAASEVAHEIAPSLPSAEIAAGAVTGLGVGGIAAKLSALSQGSKLAAALRQSNARFSTAQREFEDAEMAAAEARSAAVGGSAAPDARAAALIAQQKAADATMNAARGTIDTVADGLGTAKTLQQAGTDLQANGRLWLNETMPQKLNELWTPVNTLVPAETPLTIERFQTALEAINKSAGALEPLAAVLKPGAPRALQQQLNKILDDDKMLAKISGGTIPPTSFTWQEGQALRSAIGDAMSDPKIMNDIGEKNLSRLYAALTGDMRLVAGRQGALALHTFDLANEGSTRLYQMAEGPVNRLVAGPRADISADLAPELVAGRLIGGAAKGGSDLERLRGIFPSSVDNLAAAHLRDAGHVGWAKLSPEAKAALVANPDHRTALDEATVILTDTPAMLRSAQRDFRQEGSDTLLGLKRNLIDARREKEAAELAYKDSPTYAKETGKAVLHLVAGGMAGELATAVGHNFGINELYGHSLGALLGYMLPNIYRGARNVVRNPAGMVAPIAGASAGSNVLNPQQSEIDRAPPP